MKRFTLILFTFLPLFNHAVSISHSAVAEGSEIGHQFEVTDLAYLPAFYYDPESGTFPEEGYSYLWHTDEGHVSNREKPIFFFSTPGSHNVYLSLTPRKKGDEDLKVFTVFNFFVELWELSDASHGDITHLDLFIDGEARTGDKTYVVVPLNPCQSAGLIHDYEVGYDQTKLKYLNMLPQANLYHLGNSPIDDHVMELPLNKSVRFRYDWSDLRDDIAVVLEFEVLAQAGEPTPLKFYKSSMAPCDDDAAIGFFPIAGPYDPNYKASSISSVNVAENPEKKVNSTEVMYAIHFQNIGEAPVDSVTVFDTLPNYLTFTSFEGSSHPDIMNVSHSGGILKWIIAPDADIKGTNQSPGEPEPATKGWVRFRAEISKEEDIMYDTCYCLCNVATVYFDMLEPIQTKANVIAIGDSLCFSPDPGAQGKTYAQTICSTKENNSTVPPSTRLKFNEEKGAASFIVYPNPFSDAFQLKGDLEKIREIEVLNALGQRILWSSKYKNTIHLGNQPAGIYFVRIRTEETQQLIRVEKH